ncbi:MAG: nucleotide exchange factor GrpE [Bacteroidales bacterium]|nr:nucleotide exchange factor GrpE [Bacteroidales bacterium]
MENEEIIDKENQQNPEQEPLREEPLNEEPQEEESEPAEGSETRERHGRKHRKIAELHDKVKELSQALEDKEVAEQKLREDLSDMRDQYLRLQAEWDNYRRRTAKERLELIDNAGKDILTGFLPVVDDCQRAIEVLRNSGGDQAAIEGTELIYNKLMAYLKQRGVARIEARGTAFDTDYHEAVAQFPVEDPAKKNTVIDVTQEGYTLNGTVIRYAKVVVGI